MYQCNKYYATNTWQLKKPAAGGHILIKTYNKTVVFLNAFPENMFQSWCCTYYCMLFKIKHLVIEAKVSKVI